MKSRIITILTILAFFIFAGIYHLLCAVIHEASHILIVLLYGGKIAAIDTSINASISYYGENFTVFGEALCSVAGTVSTVIIGMILLIIYNPESKYAVYHACNLFASLYTIFFMLPWVFTPLTSLFSSNISGDDMTRFLNVTKIHPLIVSLGALILTCGFAFFICKKGMFKAAKENFLGSGKRHISIKINEKVFLFSIILFILLCYFESPIISTLKILDGILFVLSAIAFVVLELIIPD